MRTDSLEFRDKNERPDREPIIVVELSFDNANTDIHYITSATVSGLTGNIVNGALQLVSSTSQKVDPDKAQSTVGNISFDCVDVGLTALQKTKLDSGLGLNGKRVRVYMGYAGLDWSSYVLTQTQIVWGSITYKNGRYRFNCSDVQQAMRKKLFLVKETTLRTSLSSSSTTINVGSTTGFNLVFQPPIADSLAPSEEVGFIKITDGAQFEYVMWKGKTSTAFTNCTRGVFGTPVLDINLADGKEGAAVEEVVFLQAPALMIAYALLTGSWYGYPGYFLPDTWHLGISADYIKTSDFIDHPDIWDITDIDAGSSARVFGEKNVDGKRFIQEQLLFLTGFFNPIYSTGELGLKQLANIAPNGGYDAYLNERNIVDYGELKESLKSIVNRAVIQWDYSASREIYKRTSILIDQDSINAHQASDPKIIELKALQGSKDSLRQLTHHFNTIRSRYSAPPLELELTLTPDMNTLEVGDVVRVDLPQINNLNRNFEVQQVKINWVTGNVSVRLFGSSKSAQALQPDTSELISTAFMPVGVPAGNYLTNTNGAFTGIINDNGVYRITQNISLSGASSLNNMNAVYFCPGDLQIDTGVEVSIDENVQIRVDGYFTNNGTINGAGAGHSGGVDGQTVGAVYDGDYPDGAGKGVDGVGLIYPGGGIKIEDSFASSNRNLYGLRNYGYTGIRRFHSSIPELFITVTDTEIKGIPETLIGSSGSCGGGVKDEFNKSPELAARGGTGGSSGAGLCIICTGYDAGNSGLIDLSGTDGQLGEVASVAGRTLLAGAGAGGHSGGLLIVSTDSAQFTEYPSATNCNLSPGVSPTAANSVLVDSWPVTQGASGSNYLGGNLGSFPSTTNLYEDFGKVVYLDASTNYTEQAPDYVETSPTFTLTEYTNTPKTTAGDRSSIEVAVTPPNDSNYLYSEVDYRKKGLTAWQPADPASHESVIEVESDGSIYEVRVRPVSQARVASPTGEIKEITISNVSGRSDGELATIYPFSTITDLALQGDVGSFFSTRDISIEWNNNNSLQPYFNYYQVEIYSGATLIRTEKSVSPFYVYSYEKNALDYQNANSTEGIYYNLEFRVKPVSKYFNSSSQLYSGSHTALSVSAAPLTAPELTLSYAGENAVISWATVDGDFRTLTTFVKYNGATIAKTTGKSVSIPVDWVGSRQFEVVVNHLATNDSASSFVTVNPALPGAPQVTSQVIANNVTFNYESVQGSLPIHHYEIRKADTYNQAQTPDIKAGTSSFTLYQEVSGGTKVFWFEAVDTAGNRSAVNSISVQVSQPQNYQLLTSYSEKDAGWPGAKTNCLVMENNSLLLPVNTTETWSDHFSNNSFSTPQDQINAGYEYYLQPSTNTAQYIATFDYGSVIDAAIISANSAPILIDGSVTVTVTIAFSNDNVSWTSGTAGQVQVMGTDFRYVRVTLDFVSVGGDDLAYVQDILIKLDKQIDQDFGKFTANASDTNGTRIYFNKDFIDAQTPSVSVSSSAIVDVVVDFNDVPDPEYFDVYVYDRSTGNRINADGSWQVNGFTRVT